MNNSTRNTALEVELTHNERVNKFGGSPTSFFTWVWDMTRPRAMEALAARAVRMVNGGLKTITIRDETGKVILEMDS